MSTHQKDNRMGSTSFGKGTSKRYKAGMIAFSIGCALMAFSIYMGSDLVSFGTAYGLICTATIGFVIAGDTLRKSE